LVTRMSDDVSARERAQLALRPLRVEAAYDIWWLAKPGSLRIEPWYVLFPIAALSTVGLIALSPFWPPALFLLAFCAIGSIAMRSTIAERLRMVAGAFRQVAPLVAAGEVFAGLDLPE